MKIAWLSLLVWVSSSLAAPADGAGMALQFSLDREGPPPVQYTITVDGDGAGLYVPRATDGKPLNIKAEAGDAKVIHVSPVVLKKIFAAVPMVEGGRCETHNKGIAKTGVKVLRYAGSGPEAQCTYNYSDDDRVNDATAAFEGVAETLMFGDRLAAKLRFDRLGLDSELNELQSAVREGRALEVDNIASVLKRISADERVMERVRTRADRLLQDAGGGQTAVGEGPSAR